MRARNHSMQLGSLALVRIQGHGGGGRSHMTTRHGSLLLLSLRFGVVALCVARSAASLLAVVLVLLLCVVCLSVLWHLNDQLHVWFISAIADRI